MKVLSLFDGMSCGHIALDRVGINVDTYYAAEIDKYAIQVTQNNYPDTIQLGSVTEWRNWDIDWSSIDLVTGGFPCQAWSVAGKQLGDRDERGMLFWTMLDIMKNVLYFNPKAKFLMENVKMKKEFEEYITLHTEKALGTVYKHLINSALVSAQNRQRYYWTNIEGVTQPKDKGLVLKDILEQCPSEQFTLTEKNLQHLQRAFGSKGKYLESDKPTCTLTASMGTGGGNVPYIQRPCESREYSENSLYHHAIIANESSSKQDKAFTLTASYNGAVAWNSIEKKQRSMVLVGMADDINGHDCIKRIYHPEGLAPTLTTMGGGHREPKVSVNSTKYRKLTPLECERLQTVPDNYTDSVSNSQRYKMIGNGWTVDIIAHIYKNING